MNDTAKFKTKLEEEKKLLENELATVGRRNPSNPADWEATQGETDADTADRNDVADNIEQYEEHSAILKELETRYNHVLGALTHIEEGTYGTCTVGGEQIEADRLEANPAATTCKQHMEEETEEI